MPQRLFLIGFMGCGKSSTGKKMAQKLGLNFVDTDNFIENRYQKTISQLFEEVGEAKFREIEHKILLELAEFENIVIATGGGMPCFFNNMEIMNAAGKTIYLKLPAAVLYERLKKSKSKRTLLKNIPETDLQNFIEKLLHERENFYNQAEEIISD
ncbi:MAG: shikimate kinase [Prevotellaceae bacterium]|jgi:shikimate kinase|nr:shikimate kinase [Prevotellaceae bacterium]